MTHDAAGEQAIAAYLNLAIGKTAAESERKLVGLDSIRVDVRSTGPVRFSSCLSPRLCAQTPFLIFFIPTRCA